jgi:hypothetical protein
MKHREREVNLILGALGVLGGSKKLGLTSFCHETGSVRARSVRSGEKIRAATVRERTLRSRDAGSACLRARLSIFSHVLSDGSSQSNNVFQTKVWIAD